jgi:hypothetical protein
MKYLVKNRYKFIPWTQATTTFSESRPKVEIMFSSTIKKIEIGLMNERLECVNASETTVVSGTPAS